VPIELIAHSGARALPGTVPSNLPAQLATAENLADLDAERKILEHLANTLEKYPQAKGNLRLVIDHPGGQGACASCAAAIADFKSRFPNIELDVAP
jgi:hypothetical protein